MYAVIRTGGKQYRVSPGDVLVVEKLDGAPGDELRFDQVLMTGDGDSVTVGVPLIDGGVISAVLIETRKGEKIKVFKKIRRQGYRRTKGHRQIESVLRITGLEGGGLSGKWDGTVDLTPRSELVARARGLSVRDAGALEHPSHQGESAEIVVVDQDGPPMIDATVVEHYAPDTVLSSESAEAAPDASPALVEQPISEVSAEAPQTIDVQDDGVGAMSGGDQSEKA